MGDLFGRFVWEFCMGDLYGRFVSVGRRVYVVPTSSEHDPMSALAKITRPDPRPYCTAAAGPVQVYTPFIVILPEEGYE